jgi:hypothetical protein
MSPPAASQRLLVLSKQLSGAPPGKASRLILQAQPTRGAEDEVRPAPGGGKGTLTVLDNRTGKKYTVRAVCSRVAARGGARASKTQTVSSQGWRERDTVVFCTRSLARPPSNARDRLGRAL